MHSYHVVSCRKTQWKILLPVTKVKPNGCHIENDCSRSASCALIFINMNPNICMKIIVTFMQDRHIVCCHMELWDIHYLISFRKGWSSVPRPLRMHWNTFYLGCREFDQLLSLLPLLFHSFNSVRNHPKQKRPQPAACLPNSTCISFSYQPLIYKLPSLPVCQSHYALLLFLKICFRASHPCTLYKT